MKEYSFHIIHGRITNSNAEGIAGIVVTIRRYGEYHETEKICSTVTDSKGEYYFEENLLDNSHIIVELDTNPIERKDIILNNDEFKLDFIL